MKQITYKKLVDICYDVDIAVIGAGIAGISAALSAAMMGKKVLLIERFGVLGGNATSGGVANFCGNCVGQGKAFDMIISALYEFNAVGELRKKNFGRLFDHEILAVILPELLIRKGVDFLLHTRFVDVTVNDGHISEALICGPSGLEAIRAKEFIDCTGEGSLAAEAGFTTMKGGDTKYQLPMSLMYFVHHVKEEQRYCQVPEGWFERITKEEDLPMTSLWPNGLVGSAFKIKIPMFDSTDTRSMTMAETTARRKMMSILDYHQRVEKRNYVLDHCSPIIGIREGRRILGDYLLIVDDLRKGKAFDDVIAVGTYVLDGHKTDDDKRTYILDKNSLAVPAYDIPLRSIIAKDGDNLMMAGRCMSADQLALSSARVMTTGSMLGQAAGVTAALAVDQNKCIRDIAYTDVQNVLLESGSNLDKNSIDMPDISF